jgi:hypothetical protein
VPSTKGKIFVEGIFMFKCHICNLETKQLNGLLSRHYKSHLSDSYTKENYKRDLLIANDRPPKVCKFCNLETVIPKGEKDYPDLHKACYLANLNGPANNNYKGGPTTYNCNHCNIAIVKYGTQQIGTNRFCSVSCSMNFYADPDNRTPAQLANDERGREVLEQARSTDKFKTNHAAALAKMQKDRKSKVEETFFNALRESHPDAIDQHLMDFYTWDCFVPSTKELFEVQGNYWHNMSNVRIKDGAKKTFIANNHKDHSIYTIWENEIHDLEDSQLVNHAKKNVEVYILAGANGSGKTYLADKLTKNFEVIDYDKLSFEEVIKACEVPSSKPKLLVTPIKAKTIAKTLRDKDIRVWTCFIIETQEVIEQRLISRGGTLTEGVKRRICRYNTLKDRQAQFYGTQAKVYKWLKNQVKA